MAVSKIRVTILSCVNCSSCCISYLAVAVKTTVTKSNLKAKGFIVA